MDWTSFFTRILIVLDNAFWSEGISWLNVQLLSNVPGWMLSSKIDLLTKLAWYVDRRPFAPFIFPCITCITLQYTTLHYSPLHCITYGYGSIPIHTIFRGWTSIYQLFWCELQGDRVLTHPHISIFCQPFHTTSTRPMRAHNIAGTSESVEIRSQPSQW